jgi:hypothetical protein
VGKLLEKFIYGTKKVGGGQIDLRKKSMRTEGGWK